MQLLAFPRIDDKRDPRAGKVFSRDLDLRLEPPKQPTVVVALQTTFRKLDPTNATFATSIYLYLRYHNRDVLMMTKSPYENSPGKRPASVASVSRRIVGNGGYATPRRAVGFVQRLDEPPPRRLVIVGYISDFGVVANAQTLFCQADRLAKGRHARHGLAGRCVDSGRQDGPPRMEPVLSRLIGDARVEGTTRFSSTTSLASVQI